jgi:hypothetical protein
VHDVVETFQQCKDPKQRYQLVLGYASSLPPYPEELKRPENRVLGCTAQVGAVKNLRSLKHTCSVILEMMKERSMMSHCAVMYCCLELAEHQHQQLTLLCHPIGFQFIMDICWCWVSAY